MGRKSREKNRKRRKKLRRQNKDQHKAIDSLSPEKKKKRLLKTFYSPLRKLGVEIKYGDIIHVAKEVAEISRKNRNKLKNNKRAQAKLQKHADRALKAIRLSENSQKDS